MTEPELYDPHPIDDGSLPFKFIQNVRALAKRHRVAAAVDV